MLHAFPRFVRQRITLALQGKIIWWFVLVAMMATIGLMQSSGARAALVASYEFEGNLDDSSGNGHTGVAVGSAFIADDPMRGMVIEIPDAESLVDIHSVVPIPGFAPQTSITLGAWVKRLDSPNADNFRYAINLGANGDAPIATLGVTGTTNTIVGYTETDQPGGNLDQVNVFGQTVIEGGAAAWNSWHHLAIVYDRTTDLAHTYLNGVRDSTTSISLLDDTFGQTWNAAGVGKGSSPSLISRIDDATIYDHALTDAEIHNLMGTAVSAGTVDRDTGAMTITNLAQVAGEITGYSISSASGALDFAAWTPVTGNYDSNGDMSVDDVPWAIQSSSTELLEESASSGSGTLDMGQDIDLGTTWIKSPTEDLILNMHFADGRIAGTPFQYTGGPDGNSYTRSDLNFDGVVNADDWPLFYPHVLTDLSAFSPAESYQRGDLDGDGLNDVDDFSIFKADFDAANGAGAFQAMIAGVPEPSTLALLLAGAVGALVLRRKRSSAVLSMITSAGILLVATNSASAVPVDLTTFTAEAFPPASGFPVPNWTITPTTATLNSNADASVLYSPDSTLNKRFIGSLTPGTDDDVVGFVLGFNPGDAQLGSSADYLLIDWKGASQDFDFADGDPFNFFHDLTLSGNMPVGLALSRVTGSPTADELWQHTNDANNTLGGVEQLARGTTLGDAAYNRAGGSHSFDITYTADRITVKVDGVTQFDETGSFSDGRFGLYSAWQGPQPTFSNFEVFDTDFVGLLATVDRSDGNITLTNPESSPVEFDFYQITSAGNSLSTSGWNSLSDQNFQSTGDGEGESWDEAGGSSASAIGELYLQSTSSLADGASVDLGSAYNNSINAEDLVLNFRLPSGLVVEGAVEYIGVAPAGVDGDYNNNGVVDAADYTVWRDNLNTNFALPNEAATPGMVTPEDYTVWKTNFGASGLGGGTAALNQSAQVPEPAALAIVSCLVIAAAAWPLRRRVA